jgi:predicted transcriptional regulator/DNA-binding XRE family transcriptional regulator
MASGLSGLKIRALRKRAGITQAELARRARVSPSYLNLIEANKRAVAGVLLDRIARGLGVERSELDGGAERRLVESLNEIISDPALASGDNVPADAEGLVGRAAPWAELILALYRAYQDQAQAVTALADRLNRDPFLGESIHRVLTNVTAIRSAAEILDDPAPIDEETRRRFLAIIASDSHKLSEAAQALMAFFDSAQTRVRSATPMEHIDAFIFEEDNHFPELEAAAEAFLRSLPRGETAESVAAHIAGLKGPEDGAARNRMRVLRGAAARIAGAETLEIVARHPALASEPARELAVSALHSYFAGAVLMPYEAFIEAAEALRYDVDGLARRFGVSYEQAAHRLATLRRRGAEGVPFAFMRSDPSGYVTKRLPLAALPLPRYGTACPLWPVYGAFQSPGTTARLFGTLPSGDTFLFFARAVEKGAAPVGMPRRLLSVMLACPAGEARKVCYGDGIDRASATVALGTVCRLCSRDCDYRQEAAVIANR